MTSDEVLGPTFHCTAAGLLAARAGDLAFLAVPAKDGSLRLASAYNVAGDPSTWQAHQFWAVHDPVQDEAAFRTRVTELARHRADVRRLDRCDLPPGTPTPWGVAQVSRLYAPGIVQHSTAGHGGFGLDTERNALVHPLYRAQLGWYEEDEEWAKVAATFPALFTAYERAIADRTLRDSEPDAYELVNGVVLAPGQSRTKDARRFKREHARDWIVVAAITSRHRPGFVECVATLGGERRPGTPERRFLVAAERYEVGPFGFVINGGRDQPYDGPSSFGV